MAECGRPGIRLSLKEVEKEEKSIAGSRPLPHRKVKGGQIVLVVLGCAVGESQAVIAKRLGLSPMTFVK